MRWMVFVGTLALSACVGGGEVTCRDETTPVCPTGEAQYQPMAGVYGPVCGDPRTEWDCFTGPTGTECLTTIYTELVRCDASGRPTCMREGPDGVPGAVEWRPFCLEAPPNAP